MTDTESDDSFYDAPTGSLISIESGTTIYKSFDSDSFPIVTSFSKLDVASCLAASNRAKRAERVSLNGFTVSEQETRPLNPYPSHCHDSTLYFLDGIRRVDFVLTYSSAKGSRNVGHVELRKNFEANLLEEGLHLEYDDKPQGGLKYVKIHAPWELLLRYAEIMKFKMPLKKTFFSDATSSSAANAHAATHCSGSVSECQKGKKQPPTALKEDSGGASVRPNKKSVMFSDEEQHVRCEEVTRDIDEATQSTTDGPRFPFYSFWEIFYPDRRYIPRPDKRLTVKFTRDKEYIFDMPPNKDEFFSSSQRSQVVDFILKRKSFSKSKKESLCFGITKLLNDGVYNDAFPLHEGSLYKQEDTNPRWLLRKHWASLHCMFKFQPLDQVREYFGVKIGLYFAWLGFYTYMLVPAALVGLICFIFSIASLNYNRPSQEACGESKDILMCPVCDFNCSFWRLGDACTYTWITYLFDNPSTVFFAIFMSLWGTLFLELWKRYLARITFRWDLTDFDVFEEHPRPEYIARLSKVQKKRLNAITKVYEPYVPFWKERLPYTILSISVVLLLVLLAFVALIGVIIYRMSMRAASIFRDDEKMRSFAPILVSTSAAFLNLFFIIIFNQLYGYLAEYLTELEKHRTQTEFDNSLTLKMFLLQFVNYYSSIFYIAFFKGRFVGHPGDRNRLWGYQQEECGIGGCLLELSIQLAIIMVGNQALNAAIEMAYPFFMWLYNQWKVKDTRQEDNDRPMNQWNEDYSLADFGPRALFFEYLEMVLQFGFITIFVSAFPLAPLFALINNLLEIRWDARKLLTSYRRPVARRIKNIGIWYRILDSMGKLAVVSNALIIAFSSDFIPRQFYRYMVSQDGTLRGYLNYSLSSFDIGDLNMTAPGHESICRYHDYREAPGTPKQYEYRSDYWLLLVVRLLFVVFFENFIFTITTLMKWLIPDVPGSLKKEIRLRMYVVNDVIIHQELQRIKEIHSTRDTSLNLTTEAPTPTHNPTPDPAPRVTITDDPPTVRHIDTSLDETFPVYPRERFPL